MTRAKEAGRGKKTTCKKTTKKRSGSGPRRSVGILGSITPEESIEILRSLLSRHRELRKEAEKIAHDLVSTPDPDLTADAVQRTVSALDWDDASGRAGRTSWGYVEPSEAAWQMLEETVESFVTDMKRRASLGLVEGAELTCRGIIVGLYRANETAGNDFLALAEDFPAEEACYAAEELIRACPRPFKKRTAKRLVEALSDEVPEWASMLRRVLKTGTPRAR